MEGLTNREIAARLDVSGATVKNTLQQLFAKTSVRTRAQLVRVALDHFREDSPALARPALGRGLYGFGSSPSAAMLQ
jgi:DNA-binding transcriptional regulator LsrR (DeoR family)